jgi:hypothetical protein
MLSCHRAQACHGFGKVLDREFDFVGRVEPTQTKT